MSPVTILEFAALALGVAHEVNERFRSLLGWAVVALALALLWTKLGGIA